MQSLKRGMASLLAAAIVMTMLPVTALSAEEPEQPETAPSTAIDTEEREDPEEEIPAEVDIPEMETPDEEPVDVEEPVEAPDIPWTAAGDEVIYNTGSMAVTVGSDPADYGQPYYELFDADGSYTIEVNEPDPFFPYEVQFTCGGETWTAWFETPDSTVTAGGHTFRVACSGTPSSLGFQVGDAYVPAYPEEKQFTTAQNYGAPDYDPEAGIAPASLLQLEEKYVRVDFSGFLPEELTEVGVRAFLAGQEVGSQDSAIWFTMGNDTWQLEGDVDLSRFATDTGSSDISSTAQIIVGSFDQLDPDNTRYIITFNVSRLGDLLEMQAYTSSRSRIDSEYSVSSRYTLLEDGTRETQYYYAMSCYSRPAWELRSVLVGLRFREQSSALQKLREKGALSVAVYSGRVEDVSAAVPITGQIWDQNDLSVRGGYTMDAAEIGDDWVTVALEHNGKTHLMYRSLRIEHYETYDFLSFGFRAVQEDGTEWNVQNSFWPYTREDSDALHYDVQITSDEWDGAETGLIMTCDEQRFAGYGLTAAVYEGNYASEDDALRSGMTDIADEFWGAGASGYQKDYSEGVPFTLVLKKGETAVETIQLVLRTVQNQERLYIFPSSYLYSPDRTSPVTGRYQQQADSGTYFYTMSFRTASSAVDTNYPKDGKYYIYMDASTTYLHEEDYVDGAVDVKGAYLGRFDSAEEAAGQPDIKAELFSDISYVYDRDTGLYTYTGGYLADFRNGAVTFTVVDIGDKVYHVTVNTLAALPETNQNRQSVDTYFHITGVKDTEGNLYDQYIVSSSDDSYYYNGFQTIFLLKDGGPVTDSEIVPVFRTGTAVNPYVGHDEVSGEIVNEGAKEAFHHNEPVHYSAASESGTHLRNYWVTFLTQQPGAELFVNGMADTDHYEDGMPTREVLLGAGSTNYHDIFIANVGVEKLTGLYVRLENAENVRLDDYWTITGATAELAGFTSVDRSSSNMELNNVAKIRLYRAIGPDDKPTVGEIKGTLVIGSTATDKEVRIKLKGTAGIPKITTETVVDGVKYVPYSSVLQTNNMYKANGVVFDLVSGTLPNGVILKQNGEIYGVPRASGEFRFSVRATYDGQVSEVKAFQLTIRPNTDENVYRASDRSYELIPDMVIGKPTENEMVPMENEVVGPCHFELDASELVKDGTHPFGSYGPYPYYIDFWLDGKKLVKGEDYTSAEGSTILTISDATIEENGNGTHTLAAEFREGDRDEGTLKRTAQNYTITGLPEPEPPVTPGKPSGGNNGNSSGSSGSNNNNNSSNSSKPSTTAPSVPATPQTPEKPEQDTGMPFTDVLPQHWFFNNVKWVYDNKYMEGVSATLFAPEEPITQATIVTVLARLARIDLTQFDNVSYPGIEAGTWFTQPAIWATQSGLLPDFTSFTGEEPLDRNGMAIMLVKYMRSLGLDTTPPQQPAVFTDAALMTQESSDAFQILYQYNIFRGVGGNAMDPASSTTRSQFAALVQRISDFADSQK